MHLLPLQISYGVHVVLLDATIHIRTPYKYSSWIAIFFWEKPFFCEFYVVNFRKCLQMKKFAIDDESF